MDEKKQKQQEMIGLLRNITDKEKFTIFIKNATSHGNGELNIKVMPEWVARANASYSVSLLSLSLPASVKNITASNNKFFYFNKSAAKVITLEEGFYYIDEYNKEVKRLMKLNGDDESMIDISMDNSSGLVTDFIKESGYKVLLKDKSDTFLKRLGFDSDKDITVTTKSTRVSDILPVKSVYIHCSCIEGNRLADGNTCGYSDILYNFPYNYRYGSLITFQLGSKVTESSLSLKGSSLNEIKIRFTDDNYKPVDLISELVTLVLRFRQD